MKKRSNEPVMNGFKACICCGQEKHVTQFHVHRQMKDGRLNKCANCVVLAVASWRGNNLDARKIEHQRNAQRAGIKPRQEYLREISCNAAGRKVIALKYFHKRRAAQMNIPAWDAELDELAMEEAKRLADMRTQVTGFKWSVDHIVPINHRQATGLHNAFNLNVVPATWNSAKANRHMRRFFGY